MANALVVKNPETLLAGPLGSLDAYVERVSQIPVLSREDELELAAAFPQRRRSGRGPPAGAVAPAFRGAHRARLQRLWPARGRPGPGRQRRPDEGREALRPAVGVRLVSFAVHWIRAEIHEYVLRNWRLVKIATTKAQRKLFFNLRRSKKNLGWLSEAETQAVANDLGVTPARSHRDGTAPVGRATCRSIRRRIRDDEDELFARRRICRPPDADPSVAVEESSGTTTRPSRLAAGAGHAGCAQPGHPAAAAG